MRKWTEEELQYLKDNVNILSYEEIGLKLNRTYQAVASKAQHEKFISKGVGRINKRKVNKINVLDDYCELIFTNTQNITFICKFDKQDLNLVRQYYWNVCSSNGIYLRTTVTIDKKKLKVLWLHRLLMGNPENKIVDHINGDSLDNRRCNLRLVDTQINAWNRHSTKYNPSGIRGLYIKQYKGKLFYSAQIKRRGKIMFLKRYPYTEEGFNQAKQDLIRAENFINRNNCLYNSSIPCDSKIKEYILKQEEKAEKVTVKLYGYVKFCQEIKQRDNFTCCGCTKNFKDNPSKLQVHHILPKSAYPDLIMDKNNCISICDKCHESIKNREYEIAPLLNKILKTR